MAAIRKGYCSGCPYDYGQPATEAAYNWGCLPSVAEIAQHVDGGAWPCHADPDKVCCGFASQNPTKILSELRPMPGVHETAK